MCDQLENTLAQLLVPDNDVIQQATIKIRELLNDPAIVPALCVTLSTSGNAQVRQYAAVLLRKVLKKSQWLALSSDVATNIRENILQVLLKEPEKSVQKAVAQIIATVGKHELTDNKWPELLQFLHTYTASEDMQQRQMGMFVLHILSTSAAEQLRPHYQSILQLCSKTLQDTSNVLVPYYTILTLTELLQMFGSDELRPMQAMIPRIVSVIEALVPVDESQAALAMEIFDELAEIELSVIVPHIRLIMELCLKLAADTSHEDTLRVRALSFIAWITKLKRKSILKLKLMQPILNVLLPIMCSVEDDDEDDDDASQYPATTAATCIDTMSTNLPPEKFIPVLNQHLETMLGSEDPRHRCAGYVCMAEAAEGSADYIKNKLLKPWLQSVYKGLNDPSHIVRNAALFALGQFAEHLQPNISEFCGDLLPVLFESLGEAGQNIDKDAKGVVKIYYALETFVENLGKDLLPYLPQLMDYQLRTLRLSPSLRAKEMAMSAISATASAAGTEITQYFPDILEQLTLFLQASEDSEETKVKLQAQAMETLSVLARTVKTETFLPLAGETLQHGLQLLESNKDPDLRRCVYGVFAAISTLVKEEMGPHLRSIIDPMLAAIKSSEGITMHYGDEATDLVKIFADEAENLIDAEEEDEAIQGYSFGNAFMDEKEDACTSLGEIAINTGMAFLPYLEECYTTVWALLEYPAAGVRKASVTAIANFVSAIATVANNNMENIEIQTTFTALMDKCMDKFVVMIKDDQDRQVVMVVLEGITEIAASAKLSLFVRENRLDEVMAMVKLVILEKTACQDEAEEVEYAGAEVEDEETTAEHDAMLIEVAGDVLPAIAKVVGGEKFSPYFAGFLPDLLKRLKASRDKTSEKSFAIGTIGETLLACGPASHSFSPYLLPIYMKHIRDEDDEVRSNAVFGLGVIVVNGGPAMYANYPSVLKALFEVKKHENNGRVIDNICAAVCRLIDAHKDSVPMQEVLPSIVRCLPLKEDNEEHITVFRCLVNLYTSGEQHIMSLLPQLLLAAADVLGTDRIDKETQTLLVHFVQDVSHKHADAFQALLTSSSHPAEQLNKLRACVTTNINGNSS